MESINEALHYSFGALLFGAAMALVLLLASLDTRVYVTSYTQGTQKSSVFELVDKPEDPGSVILTRQQAFCQALSAPESITVSVDGEDLSAAVMPDGRAFLAYARDFDSTALSGKFTADNYAMQVLYGIDGTAEGIRLTACTP